MTDLFFPVVENWLFVDYIVDIRANVAQLVEQVIRNDQVNGSNPFIGSILTC